MADTSGLGMLGFVFGGVTFAVMLIAFVVVRGNLDGRLTLDTPASAIEMSAARLAR